MKRVIIFGKNFHKPLYKEVEDGYTVYVCNGQEFETQQEGIEYCKSLQNRNNRKRIRLEEDYE